MFKVIKISKDVIKKIYLIIKKNNYKEYTSSTCPTRNGYQSENLIKLFNKNLLKKILPLDDFYKEIFHIHYIEYFLNGYQEEHHHKRTEKYSFILYLNNSDGDTVFKEPINKRITPELGKLIFFNSEVLHRGERSSTNKKILVGAVEKNV
tara:strand:- start:92 stop:541 length:450 start_codon:yes stop_codon:yes gene_type:complete